MFVFLLYSKLQIEVSRRDFYRGFEASDNFCRTKSANADVVKDEGEKVWQRIEDAEEAKLDEELAMAKSRNTSQDGEPDENIHGEPERLNDSDTEVELEDSKLLFSRIGGQ